MLRNFRRTRCSICIASLSLLEGGAVSLAGAADLLPDLIVREQELHDHDVVTDGDRVLLRLATATANIGAGPMHVIGAGPAGSSGNRLVMQVVSHEDGTSHERPAGSFEFHPTHNHVHLEDWAAYRLRESLEGGAVGEIVAEGGKTSFCLLDTFVHDASLPGTPIEKVYVSCGDEAQGISVGWADFYHRLLYGQNIDIKLLPHGNYWLEVEVDPENHILEEDESNNLARIPVEIGTPLLVPGPLEIPPSPAINHPPARLDLLAGFRQETRSQLGDNVYHPARQELRSTGTKRKTVSFFSTVENEDHHSQNIEASVTRLGSRARRWSHFETGGDGSRNVTAALFGVGHRVSLDGGTATAFRSVGKPAKSKRRGIKGTSAKLERLILRVSAGTLFDRVHVVIAD